MSKENHPNIQAVALTMDILKSIGKHLRGAGRGYACAMINDDIKKLIEDFVVDVSTTIDEIVEQKQGTVIFDVQPGHYRKGIKYIDRKGQVFKVSK